jgi:hypothetical protein
MKRQEHVGISDLEEHSRHFDRYIAPFLFIKPSGTQS